MTNRNSYTQAKVSRSDLPDLLRGERDRPKTFPVTQEELYLSPRETLVVWSLYSVRPCALVFNDDDEDEFFSWLSTFHGDISPLSSWCHVFSHSDWAKFSYFDDLSLDFFGLEAAWSGAIISEASRNFSRPFSEISLNSCCATRTFAVARACGLYGPNIAESLISFQPQINLHQYGLRIDENTARHKALQILLHLNLNADGPGKDGQSSWILNICRHLHINGGFNDESKRAIDKNLATLFATIPGLPPIPTFSEVSAEDSVRLLRAMRSALSGLKRDAADAIAFLAGFVISQIGSSEADMRLSSQYDELAGDVVLWSSIIGGLGVGTYWGGAFQGLGRLVSRELVRPVKLFDPPKHDISFNELVFMSKRLDNLTNKIRSASRNVLNVGYFPGVSLSFDPRRAVKTAAPTEQQVALSEKRVSVSHDAAYIQDSDLPSLARRLAPHLKPFFKDDFFSQNGRRGSRKAQGDFKLK